MTVRARAIVATHVLVIREGAVLLSRRANTGYEDGNYSVPAGHVEPGETATAAGIRELAEEIGAAVSCEEFRFALVMQRQAEEPRIDLFFVVEQWLGEIRNREPEKCDELLWAPLDDLPRNVVPYVRYAIERYKAGETYAEFR